MTEWYFLYSIITSIKLISLAEEMDYYCLKYTERIWSFQEELFSYIITNNKNFEKGI